MSATTSDGQLALAGWVDLDLRLLGDARVSRRLEGLSDGFRVVVLVDVGSHRVERRSDLQQGDDGDELGVVRHRDRQASALGGEAHAFRRTCNRRW